MFTIFHKDNIIVADIIHFHFNIAFHDIIGFCSVIVLGKSTTGEHCVWNSTEIVWWLTNIRHR